MADLLPGLTHADRRRLQACALAAGISLEETVTEIVSAWLRLAETAPQVLDPGGKDRNPISAIRRAGGF